MAFDAKPIAAASIGQVHRARAKDGHDLAIKVQYPGIARSIDSDVDNVAMLLRLSGLLPKTIDIAPLFAEAKRQLHDEADYFREGMCLRRFAEFLDSDAAFHVPAVIDALSTGSILAMSFARGTPIEDLSDASQAERDRTATALLDLALRELFVFGWMQTDPNLANYRYDAESGRIVLLDFGATRDIPPVIANLYRGLLAAARDRDREAALRTLEAFGILDAQITPAYQNDLLSLFETTARALLHEGPFDFGDMSFMARSREQGLALISNRSAWRTPPAETLFVQRKLAGTYLLAARLRARIDILELINRYI